MEPEALWQPIDLHSSGAHGTLDRPRGSRTPDLVRDDRLPVAGRTTMMTNVDRLVDAVLLARTDAVAALLPAC
ncbi:MAG TPA: hypothetical protein VGN35_12950 [Jatrophihabitantaceae bacterium]|jgi:hypothetical protein|nr:hypothetical protein [Jatrophihabitantaceae bacterium]